MTTYVEARESIVTAIKAVVDTEYPTLPVFWENRGEVDTNTVGDQYMKVDIDFLDACQITVELNPKRRVFGEVVITLFVKDGAGVLPTLQLTDAIEQALANKNFAGVQLFTVTPGSKRSAKGWRSSEILAPFTFDSIG